MSDESRSLRIFFLIVSDTFRLSIEHVHPLPDLVVKVRAFSDALSMASQISYLVLTSLIHPQASPIAMQAGQVVIAYQVVTPEVG